MSKFNLSENKVDRLLKLVAQISEGTKAIQSELDAEEWKSITDVE